MDPPNHSLFAGGGLPKDIPLWMSVVVHYPLDGQQMYRADLLSEGMESIYMLYRSLSTFSDLWCIPVWSMALVSH